MISKMKSLELSQIENDFKVKLLYWKSCEPLFIVLGELTQNLGSSIDEVIDVRSVDRI